MDMFAFDRLVICGIGLIGSSVARGLRRAHADGRIAGAGQIVGVDRDAASLARALDLGVIDSGFLVEDFEAAVAQADFIVLATPVAQTRALLARLMPAPLAVDLASSSPASPAESLASSALAALHDPLPISSRAPPMRADAVVTDVGSTKGDIVAAAQAVLGGALARFVPAHPIAGTEASGVDAGHASLFDGRDAILCPLPVTDADALAKTQAFWQCLGARPVVMAAERHDALFASVSHLPHLLAFAFITHILKTDDAELRFAFAGSGFRDFSRIAASSPEMWRDICGANRAAILADMDAYLAQLGALRQAVADGDAAALESLFAVARTARSDWHQGETLAARAERHALAGNAARSAEMSKDATTVTAKKTVDAADQDAATGPSGRLVP